MTDHVKRKVISELDTELNPIRRAEKTDSNLSFTQPDNVNFANDHDNQIDNKSKNKPFNDFFKFGIKRRDLIKGGVTTAVTSFVAGMATPSIAKAQYKHKRGAINFSSVPLTDGHGPSPSISSDYQFDVLIPWGEPLEPFGPAFSYPPNAADQAQQIGIGHDGMTFFPLHYGNGLKSNRNGMLAINHEFATTQHVLGKNAPESLDDVRTVQHAHGVSIVSITKNRRHGPWQTTASDNARRIHVNTPVNFSGPAANSELLKTKNGNRPQGTVNNCANGETPWGTYLTCEENCNGYFGASNRENVWVATQEQDRYGFTENGFDYAWHLFDRRFDLSDQDYKNEENRFGWVVEIDPFDASQTPVKRTALGRFKHEGVALVVGQENRVVAYMGDDQRFDYIYKFVSDRNWKVMRKENISPLDDGALYVARFNEDGSGEWLELTINNPVLAARFDAQEEILIYTRIAADLLEATPMDRPEWTEVAPNGDVYCTLTNNHLRTVVDAANPSAPNNDGHIIRWRDTNNHTGLNFNWNIFLLAEETHGTEQSLSSPDSLMIDPDGRIFIQTDGGQHDGLNNQLLVTDDSASTIRRLFTGVTDCEMTGITTTPDRRTLFVNIQHPGNGDPSVTNFPAPQDGVTVPRDCTIVITRKNGGVVGS